MVSNMASFKANSLLLFSMVIIFNLPPPHHLIFANGDAALIEKVCRKTVVPDDCVECLKSDPRARDLRGFMLTSINCSLRQTQEAKQVLRKFIADEADPFVKNAYGNCSKDLEKTGGDLASAAAWGKVGNYKEAENQTAKAYGDLSSGSCGFVLEFDKLPADLYWVLTTGENLIQDAHDIIKQFLLKFM